MLDFLAIMLYNIFVDKNSTNQNSRRIKIQDVSKLEDQK